MYFINYIILASITNKTGKYLLSTIKHQKNIKFTRQNIYEKSNKRTKFNINLLRKEKIVLSSLKLHNYKKCI